MRVASFLQDEALTVRELAVMLAVGAKMYFPSLFVNVTAVEPLFMLPETVKIPSEDTANPEDVVEPPQVAFLATTFTVADESTALEAMSIDAEESERELVALMEPKTVRSFGTVRVWEGEVIDPLKSISLTFATRSVVAVTVAPWATATRAPLNRMLAALMFEERVA